MSTPIEVHKFGGASVATPDRIRIVAKIVASQAASPCIIVVSAMGKMTNALERYYNAVVGGDQGAVNEEWVAIADFHLHIVQDLFGQGHQVEQQVHNLLDELQSLKANENGEKALYAHIVSIGELLSTRIVSAFLDTKQIQNRWVEAGEMIRTNKRFTSAQVDLAESRGRILAAWQSCVAAGVSMLTQGFIASDEQGRTTTLGREGSDYSAAILGAAVMAERVTVWKDVPGVLSADPRHFESHQCLPHISYKEAVELAYYGAKVLHPHTMKPLQNAGIPLFVRSFLQPAEVGTRIDQDRQDDALLPHLIFKSGLFLITLVPNDFSYISEKTIGELFRQLHEGGLKVHLLDQGAVSLSICIDQDTEAIEQLLQQFSATHTIRYNRPVNILTIRHFTDEMLQRHTPTQKCLLIQQSRQTIRFVYQ